MKKIILPGLALYAVLAGLGLFLQPEISGLILIPWLAGFVVLAFTLSYFTLFSKNGANGFSFTILGIVGLNFLIQLSGGAGSPFFPSYFILITATAFQHRTRAYPVAGLILAIQALNLFRTGTADQAAWIAFGGFSLSLAGVAFITAQIAHRIRSEARTARDSYEKLLSDADAVDPLAGGTNVESLTEKNRQAINVSVARQREGAFGGLIDLVSGLVPAHTCALFLDERNDGVLTLRGIRSRSAYAATSAVRIARGSGLIGICVDENRRQYLADMVIPAQSLGYYTQDVPVKSFLVVPISQGDCVVGALAIDSLEQDAFPKELQETLTRFIPFFSQIIEKIQISLEMDIRAKNFAALHEMSSVLTSSLDITEILNKLTSQIRSVVPYDFCAFVLYNDKNKRAILAAVRGYDSKYAGSSFSLDSQIQDGDPLEQSAILMHMMRQWEHGVVRVHYDPDLGDRGKDIGLFPIKGLQPPVKSLYGRPLVSPGKFIGAVFLSSIRPHTFSEYHLKFMDTLLNQVAMVVDNSMLHQRIRDMAHTDGLTGLLNHRTFMDKLDEEFKRLDREFQPFSLLLLDIDYFKKVNDEYGHPIGDVALKCIAGVIREMARGIDFVARYGGEEFAVGMVNADSEGAKMMAERIRKAVENTVISSGRITLQRTLSIGVATYIRGCEKKETLISQADQALYHAKHAGRNRVSLFSDIKESA